MKKKVPSSLERHKIAFVYSGYGAQSPTMGQVLFRQEPVFREAVEECANIVENISGWPLRRDVIDRSASDAAPGNLQRTHLSLFALQVGLTVMWRSFGLAPHAVVGHSVGEVVAAWAADVISLSSAAHIATHMSRLFEHAVASTPQEGAMLAAEISLPEMQEILKSQGSLLSIAAHNGPKSIVLSGNKDWCDAMAVHLKDRKVSCSRVAAPGAGHSCHADSILQELTKAVETIRARPERTSIYSTVTGKAAKGRDFQGSYWARNLRQTVRFADAVDAMRRDGCDVFLEVNAHPLLLRSISASFRAHHQPVFVLPSLQRHKNEGEVISGTIQSLGKLGFPIGSRLMSKGLGVQS